MGKIIHPVDEPYFRVEVKSKLEFLSCKVPKCTFMKVGFMNLCTMHLKLVKNKAVKSILNLRSTLGRRWHHFVKLLELNSKDNAISVEVMTKILIGKFNVEISSEDL